MLTAKILCGQCRFEVKQGSVVTIAIPFVVKSTNTPIDWTGYAFTSQVRQDTGKNSPLLGTITVTAGVNPTLGVLYVTIDASGIEEGTYQYDARAEIGDQKLYVLEGELEVEGSVTRNV